MRCPECNRFVPYGEVDPELEIHEANERGVIRVDVRVILPCEECSTELKDYSDTVEFDLAPVFDFTLLPKLNWGEFEMLGTKYFARRAHDPEAGNWVVTIFERVREHVSGPRNRYGGPDHESPDAVYEIRRKLLHEYTTTSDLVLDTLLPSWAMALWNKERFEVDDEKAEFATDSKGSGRYTQMFYGADFSFKVTDKETGKEHVFEGHVQEQASSFNELV